MVHSASSNASRELFGPSLNYEVVSQTCLISDIAPAYERRRPFGETAVAACGREVALKSFEVSAGKPLQTSTFAVAHGDLCVVPNQPRDANRMSGRPDLLYTQDKAEPPNFS